MRIVIFSNNYPPLINPRAFRIGKFVELSSEQTEILVITSPVKGVIQNEKNVIRCGLQMKQVDGFRNSLNRYAFFRLVHLFLWPDDKLVHHIFYLINYLFKYRKKDDNILTVSNPFSCHLIGFVLKRIWNHKWKVDIGDIYYSNRHHSPLSKAFERMILRSTDQIIVNSESIRDHFKLIYNLPIEKFSLIPNGIHLDFTKIKNSSSDYIRLSYIGNTYARVREAIGELKILIELASKYPANKLRIQLFGNQFYKVHLLAKEHPDLIQIGYCKNEVELIQAYSNTDILINFANKNNPGLPSKLEEYVSCGLPIINFVFTKGDSSYGFITIRTNQVLQVFIDRPKIDEILSFLEIQSKNRVLSQPSIN